MSPKVGVLKDFFIRSGFIGLLVSLAFAMQVSAADKHPSPPPNILLIMADDMGYTDIGNFGSEIQTPHIDAVADQGVRFSNFHTSVSCSPTRSMLLTGTDNHIAGLGNMGEFLTPEQKGKSGYEGHLNDRVVTLAEVLRAGGYHTYMAGKWHLGDEPQHFPHARGFERSFSLLQGGASHWSDMAGLQTPSQEVAKYSMNGKELHKLPKNFYSSRSYADFLIDAIRHNRGDGKPFLAYFAPKQAGLIPENAPAPALHPKTKPWDSLSSQEKALESRTMEAYAGMIENMDYHIGRVINFLKDIGQYKNTIIIFTSDNGPNPWYAEEYPDNAGSEWMKQFDNSLDNIGRPGSFVGIDIGWACASAGPLDYFKLTVGEGGIRTPLIMAGPGIKGVRQVDSFAYVTDIMPTILELAQLEHPLNYRGRNVEPMRGMSLAGVTSGTRQATYAKDAFIGGEMNNGQWLQKGDYKAVLVAKDFGPGTWKLYNVTEDPGETRDLSKEQPAILQELQAAWDRYAKDVGVVLSK